MIELTDDDADEIRDLCGDRLFKSDSMTPDIEPELVM